MIRLVLFFTGFSFFLSSCNTESVNKAFEEDVLPIEVGATWIYKALDSTFTASAWQVDSYYLKDSVIEFSQGNFSENAFVARYKSYSIQNPEWMLASNYIITLEQDRVLYNHDGERFIALVEPVFDGKKWDRNLLNGNPEREVTVMMLPDFLSLLDNTFTGNLIIVDIEDNQDLFLNLIQEKEVFRKGHGLIYSHKRNIEWDENTVDPLDVKSARISYRELFSFTE